MSIHENEDKSNSFLTKKTASPYFTRVRGDSVPIHIQLIILYIVFFHGFDSIYSVLLLLFCLLSIVSVENATISQQSISELFSFHFCCLFNSHFFSNYQNRHFLHNLTRFFIILRGNRDSYQIVCRVYIAILNFHMFS